MQEMSVLCSAAVRLANFNQTSETNAQRNVSRILADLLMLPICEHPFRHNNGAKKPKFTTFEPAY